MDPKFEEEEQRVLFMETLLTSLIKDTQSWMDEVQVRPYKGLLSSLRPSLLSPPSIPPVANTISMLH